MTSEAENWVSLAHTGFVNEKKVEERTASKENGGPGAGGRQRRWLPAQKQVL